MTMTTIKRVQSHKDWWHTAEDRYAKIEDDPGTGITIKVHTEEIPGGKTMLSVCLEDALPICDAINALYPLEK